MVYFDQCGVKINEIQILAESVSIQGMNGLLPLYSVGKRGVHTQSPEDQIENKFNLSYILALNHEPCIPLIQQLKSLTGEHTGVRLEVGGITGFNCFLTEFSFESEANALVKVNASFTSYQNLSGTISETTELGPNDFSGYLVMGWTTFLNSGNSHLTAPIFDLSYNFLCHWTPVFVGGSNRPLQVDLVSAVEQFDFTRDIFLGIEFTGNNPSEFLPQGDVNLLRYDFVANPNATDESITISVSGAKIHQTETSHDVDDFVKTKVTMYNYY